MLKRALIVRVNLDKKISISLISSLTLTFLIY